MNHKIIFTKNLLGGGKSPLLITGKILSLLQFAYSKVIANRKAVA